MILDSWVEPPGQEQEPEVCIRRALARTFTGCPIVELEESSVQTCIWAAVLWMGPGRLPLCFGLFFQRTFVPAGGDSSLLPADSGRETEVMVFSSPHPWDPDTPYAVGPGSTPRAAAAWLREMGLAGLPAGSEERRVAAALLPAWFHKPQLALRWAEATSTALDALPEEWIRRLRGGAIG